jgi:hypothetical protein
MFGNAFRFEWDDPTAGVFASRASRSRRDRPLSALTTRITRFFALAASLSVYHFVPLSPTLQAILGVFCALSRAIRIRGKNI